MKWLIKGLQQHRLIIALSIVIVPAFLLGCRAQSAASLEEPASPEIRKVTLRVDTLARTFSVFAPPSIPASPAVVLAFHGGAGGTGDRLRGFIGADLEPLAVEKGFLVAYPNGYAGTWNGCRFGATIPANQRHIDDLSFVEAMIAFLHAEYDADLSKVYAMGFSNGAHLALRLGLERPDAVRAIALFGANVPAADAIDCNESGAAVPVLFVNGTADRINPFDGGEVVFVDGTNLGRVRSASASLDYFGRLAGHSGKPAREILFEAGDTSALRVERIGWRRAGLPEVMLFAVHGGGHTIPSQRAVFPEFLGPVERRFSAVAEAVHFFERQRLEQRRFVRLSVGDTATQ